MSNNYIKLELSDNFNVWRDKINHYMTIIQDAEAKVNEIVALPKLPALPPYTSDGLLLTNKLEDNKHIAYWRDAESLFQELGLTLEKDESGNTSKPTLTVSRVTASSSMTCNGMITTSRLQVNKDIKCNSYINATGTITSSSTITGKEIVSKTSVKGQGLTLSHTKPYIEFFFNNSSTKTSNIAEYKSGILTINGNEFSSSGSIINSDLRLRASKNDIIFKNDDSSFAIKFSGVGEGENTLNPFSVKLSSGVVTLGNGIYSDLRILPVSSSEKKSLIIRNSENKAHILISDSLTGVSNSLSPFSIDMTNGDVHMKEDVYTNKIYVDSLETTYNGNKIEILKNGKLYNAVWNDYAEFFERGEETEVGDFIALDENSEEEIYVKATNPRTIVGVHSDSYGHILGGTESIENSEESFIPVGIVGRVKAKIIGSIERGDEIVLSKYPGIGRKYHELTDKEKDIIGFACETNLSEEIKLVKIKI